MGYKETVFEILKRAGVVPKEYTDLHPVDQRVLELFEERGNEIIGHLGDRDIDIFYDENVSRHAKTFSILLEDQLKGRGRPIRTVIGPLDLIRTKGIYRSQLEDTDIVILDNELSLEKVEEFGGYLKRMARRPGTHSMYISFNPLYVHHYNHDNKKGQV